MPYWRLLEDIGNRISALNYYYLSAALSRASSDDTLRWLFVRWSTSWYTTITIRLWQKSVFVQHHSEVHLNSKISEKYSLISTSKVSNGNSYHLSPVWESLLLPNKFGEIWVYWKDNCCSVAIIEVSNERMWSSQPISTMFLKRLAKETKMRRIKNLHVEIYMKTF